LGHEPKKFIQVDIEPKEMDSNVEIAAPVVGYIGSCVSAMLARWAALAGAPADWSKTVTKKREENVAKMAPRLMNNNSPMDYHGALGVLRTVIKERPDAILVNEGANTLDLARGIIDMYQPRKRLDVGTWGIMGIGMGYAIAAAIETGKPVLAVEGDSAFGFSAWRSRRSAATSCRSASSSSTTTASIAAPTSTRQVGPGADRLRQGRALRQDDGGLRRRRRQCDVPR
jgi:oxalyl-CoA decarboxylase